MLTYFVKIFKVLNSEQSPAQIAAAISLAAIIGITPLLSLHNLIVILLVLWFRVNLTFFLVAWPLFTLLGLLLQTPAEALGLKILQAENLVPMWEAFYNTLLGRWSNFYYSVVLGSLCISLAIALLLFPISKLLIVQYRKNLLAKIEQYKIVKLLKASKFWQMYQGMTN